MSDRYVQSKWSKDAPVYVLVCEERARYIVRPVDLSTGQAHNLVLPTSEYVEVPAPERWEEVVVLVKDSFHAKDRFDPGGVYHDNVKIAELLCKGKYRIKTLIVERKVNP